MRTKTFRWLAWPMPSAPEDKEDLDLAASLLDENLQEHRPILSTIESKRRERNQRQQRLRTMKSIAFGMVAIMIGIGCLAFVMIRKDRNQAVAARQVAVEKRQEAETAKIQEAKQRQAAENNQRRAVASKKAAERAAQEAAESAAEAKRQERKAARESYAALIGLAAARSEENAFREASAMLDQLSDSPFRHWEWGRLKYGLLGIGSAFRGRRAGSTPSRSIAVVAGSQLLRGTVRLSSGTSAIPISRFVSRTKITGCIRSLFTRWKNRGDGRQRSSDSPVSTATGKLISAIRAHADSVLSVDFSPDGLWLVTASYDKTAAVLDVSDPLQVRRHQVLQGHSWWVHDASYSPDGRHIVTAGQDGKVVVWSNQGRSNFRRVAVFSGHEGQYSLPSFRRRIISSSAGPRQTRHGLGLPSTEHCQRSRTPKRKPSLNHLCFVLWTDTRRLFVRLDSPQTESGLSAAALTTR